ncbi:MAG: phosphate acetyltransferase, partial [Corynebacterium camporealensis]|nr:phosphate acetyltransferase [Corynebacterium camporealensis]
MSATHPALISVVGRDFDGLDIPALATELDANFVRLEELGETISDVLSAAPADAVVQGTGDVHFD